MARRENLARFDDRWTLRYVRVFAAPIQRVWSAVTRSEELNVWLLPVSRVEPRLGGAVSFTWGAPEHAPHVGEVTRFEPPQRIRFQWRKPGRSAGPFLPGYLEFVLEPVPEGTRFTFLQKFARDERQDQSGFDPDDHAAGLPAGPDSMWRPGFVAGFHLFLDELGQFLREAWSEARIQEQSARNVELANTRGQAAFESGPGSEWAELVEIYRDHIASTCPPADAPGHLGHVLATLFDVDGARLYSASIEGSVHVWDVATGAPIESWPCHDGPILALQRSQDGARVFTASHDGSVGIWDARHGGLLRRLTGHRGGVHSLALCGRQLASGGYDATVRLWDVETGTLLATLTEHSDAVTALAFLSPERLASGSRDHSIWLWDLKRGSSSRALRGHRHWVTRLAALPDGRRMLSAGEDGLCIVWDCERGEILWSGDGGGPIWGFALAPNGERAVTGGAAPTLCWDIRSGVSRSIDLRPSSVRFAERSADISPDGTRVAGGNSDSVIVIYDLDRDEVVQRIPGASRAYLSAVVLGDRVVTGCGDGSLVLHGEGEPRRLAAAHAFMAYTLCPVGAEHFASGGFDRAVCVWDGGSSEPLARFDHGGYVFSVAASADGSRILSAGEDAVCIWDVASQRRVHRTGSIGSGFHTVADLGPDGGFVAAGEDDMLRAFKPDGALMVMFPIPRAPISAVRIFPDGRRVALAEGGGAVRLLDLATGAVELLHEAHEDWVRRVHVTPDGRHVVSDSQNGICCIYALATRRLLEVAALQVPIVASAVGPRAEIVAVSARAEILPIELAPSRKAG